MTRPAHPVPHRDPTLPIGVAGGVVGGLLGGGSGVLFVPALDRFTALSRVRVHGTSTVANIAVCAVGALAYALAGGRIDLHAGAGMIVGGVLGGLLGPRLLARAPETLLRVLLIAVLILTATKLYLDAAGLDPVEGRALVPAALAANPWFTGPVTVAAGAVIGAWAGAMGLGGGLLAVPTLVLVFGVELHVAEGTSLLMFLPNSIVGGLVHLRQGTAAPRTSALLGLGAVPGTVAGALLSLALSGVTLGLVFGTFTLIMAVREIIQLARARARAGGTPGAGTDDHPPPTGGNDAPEP